MKHESSKRVEWQETRCGDGGQTDVVYVLAEKDDTDDTGWCFYERTSWDVVWIRVPPTLAKLARALTTLEEQAKSENSEL